MQSKKINYVLLPLAIVIWGYAIYFFLVQGTEKEGKSRLPVKAVDARAIMKVEMDTFSLLVNYADPFTKSIKPIGGIKSAAGKVKPSTVKPQVKIQMPSFVYKGFISAQGHTNVRTGIFDVQGKQVILKEKQDFNGITVLNIKETEVAITWENEKFTFPLHRSK